MFLNERMDDLPYRLVNDALFKIFFARDVGIEFLKHFLSACLKIPMSALRNVKVLNPELTGEQVQEKSVILDILIELADGRKIQVEIQVAHHKWFKHRVIYQNAQLITEQMERGDKSYFLSQRISLVLTDFEMFTDDSGQFHHQFIWRDEQGQVFSDVTSIHVVELPKVPILTDSAEVDWYRLFQAKTPEELQEISKKSEVMRKAVSHLEYILTDDNSRQLAEARAHYLRLENDLRASGFDEGFELGEEQATVRERERAIAEKIEIAREGFNNGLPFPIVQMMTRLEDSTLLEIQAEVAQ